MEQEQWEGFSGSFPYVAGEGQPWWVSLARLREAWLISFAGTAEFSERHLHENLCLSLLQIIEIIPIMIYCIIYFPKLNHSISYFLPCRRVLLFFTHGSQLDFIVAFKTYCHVVWFNRSHFIFLKSYVHRIKYMYIFSLNRLMPQNSENEYLWKVEFSKTIQSWVSAF